MILVVDASIAVKWAFKEEYSEIAEKLLYSGIKLVAPDLLLMEVSNTIWKKCRRNEIISSEIERILQSITSVFDEIRPSGSLFPRPLILSTLIDQPVYDCVYLSMAELYQIKVLTADQRFFSRVRNSSFADIITWIEDPIVMQN